MGDGGPEKSHTQGKNPRRAPSPQGEMPQERPGTCHHLRCGPHRTDSGNDNDAGHRPGRREENRQGHGLAAAAEVKCLFLRNEKSFFVINETAYSNYG